MASTAGQYSWQLQLPDPAALTALEAEAATLAGRWRGRVGALDIAGLRELLEEIEGFRGKCSHLLSLPSLALCRATADRGLRALSELSARTGSAVSGELFFFEHELGERLAGDPGLAGQLEDYAPFLAGLAKRSARRLPHDAERLLDAFQRHGSRELARLCTDRLLGYRFRSGRATVGFQQMLALKLSDDPGVARSSAQAVARRITADGALFESAMNVVVAELGNESALRGFSSPFDLALDDLGIDLPAYDAACSAMHGVLDAYRRSSATCAAPRLRRYFPLDISRELVLSSLQDFDGLLAGVAERLFDGHVDACPRPGKQAGAFCRAISPDIPPYILLNHSGTLGDLLALAHEIGHGAHYVLSSGRSFLNYFPQAPVAELFALFCEKLVLSRVFELFGPAEREMYGSFSLERAVSRSVAQLVRCEFERQVHSAHERIPFGAISDLWRQGRQRLSLAAVPASEGPCWALSTSLLSEPFYSCTYAVAEPVAELMYRAWLDDGRGFSARCLDVLADGSGVSFAEATGRLGLGSASDAVTEGMALIARMAS